MAPLIVAGLIMVIWGATPVATRLAVADLDPLHVGLLRTALAGVLALPIALTLRLPLPKRRGDWALLLVSAATGFIIFPLIYSFGQRETSAMHGGMILAALPVFTGSYAAAVEHVGVRVKKRTLIVLFTQLVDHVAAAELLRLLRGLLPRHLPLLVPFRDVEVEALAAGPVQDAAPWDDQGP